MAKPSAKRPRISTEEARRLNPEAFISPAAAAAAKKAQDAANARTPREILDAFSAIPLCVGEIVLRPLNLGSLMILERIEHPLADESLAAVAEMNAEQTAAIVFVLTRPEVESLDLLAQGRTAFDRACLSFASRIAFEDLNAIGLKLRENFVRAFATLIATQKKTEVASSTPPPATASAGG